MHRGLNLSTPIRLTQPGHDDELPPTRVVLTGAEHLVPPKLSDNEITAWLSAPLGGIPLYSRLLAPLTGIPVVALEVCASAPAPQLHRLLSSKAVWPTDLVESPNDIGPGAPPLTTLLLPLDGLPMFDAAGLVMLSQGTGLMRWVAMAELEGAGRRAAAVALPPGILHFEDLLAEASPDAAITVARRANCALALEAGGNVRPTASAAALRETARVCLDGELLAAGLAEDHLEQEILIGDAVWIGTGVRIEGPVAIGDGSRIEPGAVLLPGTILGQGCRVGPGARIEDAVVLDGGRVEAGERLAEIVRTPERDLT